jgi:hypothetical protein
MFLFVGTCEWTYFEGEKEPKKKEKKNIIKIDQKQNTKTNFDTRKLNEAHNSKPKYPFNFIVTSNFNYPLQQQSPPTFNFIHFFTSLFSTQTPQLQEDTKFQHWEAK